MAQLLGPIKTLAKLNAQLPIRAAVLTNFRRRLCLAGSSRTSWLDRDVWNGCSETTGGASLARTICTSHSPELSQQKHQLDSSGNTNQSGGPGETSNDILLTKAGKHVAHIQINRPKVKNAFSVDTGRELIAALNELDADTAIRCVIVSGSGPDLTSGVDLKSFMSVYAELQAQDDAGRRAKLLHSVIEQFQAPFKRMHSFSKPIVCVQHGLCLGLGMELAACSDIRYCTRDARLAIREVLIGIAADVGSLQEMPRLTSNQSLLNELIFTGRDMTTEEAASLGFVSRVFDDKPQAIEAALNIAAVIAARSPVAVQGAKRNLRFSRDKPYHVGLDYNAVWNMSMMQSEDVARAIGAIFSKESNTVEFDDY